MLSDEKLLRHWESTGYDRAGCQITQLIARIRAVAEAAVKDAVGGDEPVAFIDYHDLKVMRGDETFEPVVSSYALPHDIPLYASPQASAAVPEDWREVMQGLVECARDEIVRCEGMKCREPNCISCNDELEATTSVERSREFVFRARAMLAASQPEVKS
jgi:hypothetical protein